MSAYSLRRATKFCARRARHNCMITLPACGSMLTLGVFRRGHIFLGFGSLVLSGADIPYACFDPLHRSGGSRTEDSQSQSSPPLMRKLLKTRLNPLGKIRFR